MLDASLCISDSKFMDLWPTINIRVTFPSWICIDCTVILNRNTSCDVLIDKLGMILYSKASFARQLQEPGRRPSNDKKNEKRNRAGQGSNSQPLRNKWCDVPTKALWVVSYGVALQQHIRILARRQKDILPVSKKKLFFQISKLTGGGWETKKTKHLPYRTSASFWRVSLFNIYGILRNPFNHVHLT